MRCQYSKRGTSALPWGTESPNLDFLRASAVLVVLGFHVLAYFGIRRAGIVDLEAVGMFGVLAFFVHTSLVLMLSLERQLAKCGRARMFLIFMARRCFRIYPLSIFVVVVILFFTLPLAGHPWAMSWPHPSRLDILANLVLAQNVTWSNSVEGPLWSLPYEVQMYVFLPALFLLARKLRSPWTLVASWLLVVAAISTLLHLGHGHALRYVPCFLPGIIAYKFSHQAPPRWRFWGWPVLVWGLSALYGVFNGVGLDWLICLVIGLSVTRFVEPKSSFLRQASYFISKYSYGFYLSHYFCLWLAFTKLRSFPIEGQWVIFASTVVLLPVVLYHALERPFIHIGKSFIEKWLSPAPRRLLAHKAA